MTISSLDRHDEAVRLRHTGLTWKEIGLRLGVSRERARQLAKVNPPRPKPDITLDSMLKVSDVARLLGLHVNTVRRWSERGALPAYRISARGDRRFRREDIDKILGES